MTDTPTPLPDMPAALEPAEDSSAVLVRVTVLADPLIARVVAEYPDTALRLPVVLDLGSATLTISERDIEVHKPGEPVAEDGESVRYCECCHYVWPCKDAPAEATS